MPDYRVNWHHRTIAGAIDRLVSGQSRRTMVFAPPRHGKSEIASRRAPAYVLGRNPRAHVIACSYGSDLAGRMNRDVQRIIDSQAYAKLYPATRLRAGGRGTGHGGEVRTNDLFEVVGHGGSYRSAGVGGGITGMGFDLGIVDDPFKNQEEASSPTIREKVWEWYTTTFWTRQAPNAAILLIMTRWHPDDLAGRLLEQMENDPSAERWEVINLPAVSTGRATTPDDTRKEGEPLWPERYGLEFLAAARATLTGPDFEALYQGNPTEEGGNHFKEEWFRGHGWEWHSVQSQRDAIQLTRPDGTRVHYYQVQCPRFIIVDPAASEKEAADYTAMGVFATTPTNELLLLHMVRERLGVDRIVPRLKSLCAEWKPDWVGMEADGFQVAIARQAQQTVGIPAVRELSHEGKGKLVRATPAIIKCENRQIYLPKVAEAWVKPLLEELVSVKLDGKDPHDDQADVVAYAVVGMPGLSVPTVVDNRSRDQNRGRR